MSIPIFVLLCADVIETDVELALFLDASGETQIILEIFALLLWFLFVVLVFDRGNVNFPPLGDRGDLGINDANIPPGVLVADAIPPPGENNDNAVGDSHGKTTRLTYES